MKSSARNISLTPLDDLFSTEEERSTKVVESVVRIPISELYDFPNHPFKVRDDERMAETVKSVEEYGVLVPIIVRPRDEGGYEIVSGHRRKHACELAGMPDINAIVRELDDDAATIIMVDSNLQRENILPSERAQAYKMKLEAIKHQGERRDLTSTQVGQKSQYSVEKVAEDHSISFSSSDMTLESEDTSFVGNVRVSFTGLTGGYTLDTSAFPAGTSITGYTGSNGDTLRISVPEEYEESAFPLRASGVYDSTEAVLFFYAPTTYGQQRVVTCTIDMQSTTVDSGMTVRTPKAPIRTGTIQLTKVDENGASLQGISFALYDSGKNEIQNGQTDANGAVSFEVPIGDYFYAETATLPHLVLDSTLYTVSVTEGGQLVSKTVVNEFTRGNLKIVKRDAYEDTPLSGAGFRLYDSDGQQIAEGYADANGELTFESLLYGSYSYQEFAPPKGYELDDTVYPFSITEHGVTVTQKRDNLRRPGTRNLKKIFALLLAILVVSSFSVTALAAPVDEATIDTSRTGTLDIYKYDLTNGATRS